MRKQTAEDKWYSKFSCISKSLHVYGEGNETTEDEY